MHKKALALSCYICAAGAIGAFIRWLQNQIAITDSSLYISSPISYLLGIYIAVIFILFIRTVKSLKKVTANEFSNFEPIFFESTRLSNTLTYLFSGMLFFGGLYLFISSHLLEEQTILFVIAILAMLSGLAVPICLNLTRIRVNLTAISILLLLPIALYFCWTLYTYKINSSNPSIWSFAIEILAVTAVLLSFYYLAGFAFQRANVFTSIIFLMFASYIGIVTLADDRNFGMELILAASVGILISFLWKIILNLGSSNIKES